MWRSAIKILKTLYSKVLQSIAFYPVLISFGFFLLAFIVLELESLELAKNLKEKVPYLFIEDYETARSILTTLIGGILSLTVFSFTMVMVVLSQASANFSPRLLPSLISNRKHQLILGVYIGTLLYCIIILIVLGAHGIDTHSVGFSTMLAAISAVFCIGLFVYFIHSISVSIQIQNIIDNIFRSSSRHLDKEYEDFNSLKVGLQKLRMDNFETIYSHKSGYFRGFDASLLSDSLVEHGHHLEILPYVGQHLWEGMPIIKVQNSLEDGDLEDLLLCINISSNRNDQSRGIDGFIKLMEIAVKAMSPGINDPGTAIDAINKLAPLLIKIMRFPNKTSNSLKGGKIILVRNNITAKELLQIIVQPIRLYANKDSSVVLALLGALKYIAQDSQISTESREEVTKELEALKMDVEGNIDNKYDREKILTLFN
ncbi:DUF2254 domain-containing protein [Arenibacter sp. TNZ]|jgi:uncharacterized membrane protein|uniref:DUF2254 domain-containing protein n=1 Tax=Arenibacter sp. TNZ TaxID=2183744 RepID=UPI000CD43D04|nr:DUF2254 domain-containing protein [Arenibacter sp. TNZ]MCM4173403.1 DUF2254 domain-containing protein [Arenibacter sp. TNZ]